MQVKCIDMTLIARLDRQIKSSKGNEEGGEVEGERGEGKKEGAKWRPLVQSSEIV